MPDPNVGLPASEGNPFPEFRGRAIRVDDVGRVSLNDIWQAAGSFKGREPSEWHKLPQTKDGVAALLRSLADNRGKSPNKNSSSESVLYAERGRYGGTWAHPNLAIQYAGYLSPDLRIEIHRIFLRYKLADPSLADEILERGTPEDNEWAARRALSRLKRNQFTAELATRGVEGRGYPDCTNANYAGLYGKDAADLRKERGLPAKANVRDHLDSSELVEVMLSEDMARRRMQALDDRGNAECIRSCYTSSSNLRRMLEEEDRQIEEERRRRGMP